MTILLFVLVLYKTQDTNLEPKVCRFGEVCYWIPGSIVVCVLNHPISRVHRIVSVRYERSVLGVLLLEAASLTKRVVDFFV